MTSVPPPRGEAMPEDSAHNAAIQWHERGQHPIRVRPGSKAAMDKGWQEQMTSEQLLALVWANCNIGLLVGVGEQPLAVIDSDHERARRLKQHFLPTDGMTTARDAVEGVSHVGFVVKGTLPENASVSLPEHGALVELHARRRHVVVGPSVHPDGSRYRTTGTPQVIEASELLYRFRCLATATIASLAWPGEGERQKAASALAGLLERRGVDVESTVTIVTRAAEEAGDDEWEKRGEAVRSTFLKAAQGGRFTGTPELRKLLGRDETDRIDALWSESSLDDGDDDSDGDGLSLDALLHLAESADLFTTDMDELHATVAFNGREQMVKVGRNTKFRLWLQNSCFEQFGKVPAPGVLDTVISLVTARAESRVEQRVIRTRVAPYESGMVLDLADEPGQVVVVMPGSWHVRQKSPVALRSTKGQLALPVPVGGGNLEALLGGILRVGSRDNLRLCVAWLLAALLPNGPYPIALFTGEEGTGKTETTRMLRRLIDPVAVTDRQVVRDSHELAIISQSNWVVAFDNLDGLPKWLSNALCGLSTGLGFTIRTLYTNDEETQFRASNPQIINGIGDIATRGDLLSRILMIALSPIPTSERKTLRELKGAFEESHPRILGAALDVIADSLDRIGKVETPELPRLADFAEVILAMEPALGWPQGHIIDLLNRNAAMKTSAQVDASVVAEAVIAFTRTMPSNPYEEGASKFLKTLTNATSPDVTNRREWPKAANHLTREIGRIARTLRESHHIDVDVRRTRNGSVVTIHRHDDDATSVPPRLHRHAEASVVMPDGDDGDDVTMGDAETPVAPTLKVIEALRAPEDTAAVERSPDEPSSPIVTSSPVARDGDDGDADAHCSFCDMGDDLDANGCHADEKPCPRLPPLDPGVP